MSSFFYKNYKEMLFIWQFTLSQLADSLSLDYHSDLPTRPIKEPDGWESKGWCYLGCAGSLLVIGSSN